MGRKAWFKLWQDKLLASIKWRRLPYQPRSLYLHLMLFCSPQGRLEVSNRPLTIKDIRDELTRPGDDRPRVPDVRKWVDELLSVGLLELDQETLWLTNFGGLQRRHTDGTRTAPGRHDGTPKRDRAKTYNRIAQTEVEREGDPYSPHAPGQPQKDRERQLREMLKSTNPAARQHAENALDAEGYET